jgi:1,2-diacylglycerol 3-beta-galactosyltransferase
MKRVLFLFSDTGGGHRAAAEAIRDALLIRHPDEVSAEIVDVFRAYSPFPLKYMPEFYPWLVNRSKSSWAMGYHLTNSRESVQLLSLGIYNSIEKGLKRMLEEHPADAIVCVHSVLNSPTMRALRQLEQRPPYITVVTDLVSTHHFWYDPHVDRCLVPTQQAYERGLRSGLKPEQMRVTGLPVHPHFAERLKAKAAARAELGWNPDLPTIVLVGGGEGMGPLYKTARALNDERLNCQLVIIAGRNQPLKEKLESSEWHQPTHIYPFVSNMPVIMAGADILVTKAGPATICEACIAGLPVILYDAIPGQETGNIDFVVRSNAGIFAPTARAVTEAVAGWLAEGAQGLQRRSENARSLGRPNAVWEIADEVWQYAQMPPIHNPHRPSLAQQSQQYLKQYMRVSSKSRRF